jgi:hemerythrin superfamily protein
MDAIELLTKQHRAVDVLFSQVTHYDKALEWEITRALTRHAQIEELHFYPALVSKEETVGLVSHAKEEHQEVKDLLVKWEKSSGEAWLAIANKIIESVRHHVKEEEGEMFPKVKEAFTQEELEQLGKDMAV